MELDHSLTVALPADQVWTGLLDIEQVATCLPGAAITSVEGDTYNGTAKVKLGPIALTYRGQAHFAERNDAAHRAVIEAQGRDARGNGTASARVIASLKESGGVTTVAVHTELDITGKPAQFGRGVIVDVSNRLFGQFADALAAQLQSSAAAPDEASGEGTMGDAAVSDAAESEPAGPRPVRPAAHAASTPSTPSTPSTSASVSALALLGPALAKRAVPLLLALLLLVIVPRRIARSRRLRRHEGTRVR